jgi:membrane-associated HD superfamily phosphohydrolase
MSPGLSGRQLPPLTEEDVGRPFRASSVAGFKASRDFEVPDEAATQKRREEARARVRPVFDLDPSVESKVKRGVREAFGAMRDVVSEHLGKHPPADSTRRASASKRTRRCPTTRTSRRWPRPGSPRSSSRPS